jgi:hypothetical protein
VQTFSVKLLISLDRLIQKWPNRRSRANLRLSLGLSKPYPS